MVDAAVAAASTNKMLKADAAMAENERVGLERKPIKRPPLRLSPKLPRLE